VSVFVLQTIDAVRTAVQTARQAGRLVGLVPTMGALHAAHVSLIQAARQETGFVVVSIFVNPTQFGPTEDYGKYPRSFEEDVAVCRAEKADLVFAPAVEEMYPAGFRTSVEVQELQDVLCGSSRRGHFRGVCTVVLKLLEIVRPDIAFFGQKDAQQALIIKQMVRDLNVPVGLRVCPIVREADGLAMSSRNRFLTPEQRQHAGIVFRTLEEARKRIESGERDGARLRRQMASRIEAAPGAVLEYAAVVDGGTLRPLEKVQGEVLLALAVKFGATRLIDNVKVFVAAS
jgi:pantoate--beta-alanine ligase